MKSVSRALEVPNSLLYVSDSEIVERPEIDGPAAVWPTRSCIAISCFPDCDGANRIAIGPSDVVGRDEALVFDDVLNTPSGEIIVRLCPARKSFASMWRDRQHGFGFGPTATAAPAMSSLDWIEPVLVRIVQGA